MISSKKDDKPGKSKAKNVNVPQKVELKCPPVSFDEPSIKSTKSVNKSKKIKINIETKVKKEDEKGVPEKDDDASMKFTKSQKVDDIDDNEEQEDPNDYKPGGYYPVTVMSIFNERYCAVRKIGWGHFSTVWLSWDFKNKQFVALKILKSAQQYREVAMDEIKLLKCSDKSDMNDPLRNRIVQLMETFTCSGVNGTHVVMVFEMLGCNLLKLIIRSDYRGIPLENVRTITRQLLEALNYLHNNCMIIHTDVKPENILLCNTTSEIKKLAMDVINATKNRSILSHAQRGSFEYKKEYISQLTLHRSRSPSPHSTLDKTTHSSSRSMDDGSFLENSWVFDKMPNASENVEDAKSKMPLFEIMPIPPSTKLPTIVPNSKSTYDVALLEKDLKAFIETDDKKLKEKTCALDKEPWKDVCDLHIKVVDLGNGCFTHHHFTEDVQTRQYRAVEVILGIKYTCAIDIWSVACLAFELATGSYLFEPVDQTYCSRDDDHLCLISELLGPIPISLQNKGKFSRNYFHPNGTLKRGKLTSMKPLKVVLMDKYRWPEEKAKEFSDFLLPMLNLDPSARPTADQCLQLPWLKMN